MSKSTYILSVREISDVIKRKQLSATTSLDHNSLVKTLISVTNQGLDNHWTAEQVVDLFLEVIGEYTPEQNCNALPVMILKMQLAPLVSQLAEQLEQMVQNGMDLYYFNANHEEADAFFVRMKDELHT